jgi:Amino acid permease
MRSSRKEAADGIDERDDCDSRKARRLAAGAPLLGGDSAFAWAAALGEETNNPRRNIPAAISTAVAVTGVFYVVVMLAQSLGFGIDANGVKAFSTSGAPLGDLVHGFHLTRLRRRDQLRCDGQRLCERSRDGDGGGSDPLRDGT